MELVQKYRQKSIQFWKGVLSSFILFLVVALFFHFLRPSSLSNNGIIGYLSVIGIILLIFLVLELTVYLNYLYHNKDWRFTWFVQKNEILIETGRNSYKFKLDEIELIEQIRSYPFAEKRIHWLPSDGYNYSILKLKKGQKIIITSILVPKLELPLDTKRVKLKKTFIAYTIFASSLE